MIDYLQPITRAAGQAHHNKAQHDRCLTLVSVFVIALFMSAFPAKYGFYLNEFDPYYDYKAAYFIVNSFDQSWAAGHGGFPGLLNYFSWTDYTTWFPEGGR